MERSKQKATWDEGEKVLTVQMEIDSFNRYLYNSTLCEIYLPYSEIWKARLLSGRKLKPHLSGRASVVVRGRTRMDGKSELATEVTAVLVGADVRAVPIRQWERPDKHIVLYTSIIK